MKNCYTLRAAGMSLLFAIAALLGFNHQAFAEANYVYHEATTNNPGCGTDNYRSVLTPSSSQSLKIAWKVEYQFYADQARVYYTTDGSTPSGSNGTGTGTTQVLTGAFSCTFNSGGVVDVVTATIPAQRPGTVVKYIVSAWHSGGGNEIFANGCGNCGTPTNSSSLATVFSYTVANSNNVDVYSTGGTTYASYATLASAITAINGGTHTGTITAYVLNGYAETAPAGGYSITATGTSGTPITFKKTLSTGSNPVFTASAALVAGNLNDAIIKIIGGDYITIDGLTLQENAANTTTAAATNNMTEWGVALIYATTTDGAQNCTIQNCTITLNRTYQNTFGIYSNSTHSAASIATSASATGTTGGNSGLKIYGNSISNVNQGISVVGPTAAADMNAGLDIGGTGGVQANSITNWGTTGVFSAYVNVSGTLNGILVRNTLNYNIAYNTITSSVGGNTVSTQRGIYVPGFTITPTGTQANTINNNNISIKSGTTSSIINGITVESGTASATSSISINTNDFNNTTHTVASSGGITFITCTVVAGTTNINSNTFTNLNVNTTGSVTLISNSVTYPTSGNINNINSNVIVTGFTRTGAGSFTGITTGGSSVSGVVKSWMSNNISNVTLTGASTFIGINETDGGTVNHNISSNTISNITGGSNAVTGINSSFGGGGGGSGNLVTGNIITNLTGSGAVTGISISSSGTVSTVTGNTVSTLSSTGAAAVAGITSAAPTSCTITTNKVYDISNNNASGSVIGVQVTGGTLHTITNNLIGDLRASIANAANPLIGLNITGGTTVNAYYNTVYLNGTSTGALFGSSAVSASTTPTLTLRNNIFINNSTPNSTGLTVAYRRSTTTLTTYNNSSNNNIFYAGTPGASRLIFYDGTNSDQTLGAYQTRVAPRDAASQTENVSFLSTTGSSADFLHVNPAIPSYTESGGSPVTGITDDYDGNARNATTPDIGADEYNGIAAISCFAPGNPAASAITTTSATVSWTAATGATQYAWELRTSGGCGSGSPLQSGTTASLSVNLTGLSASTTYTFCVRTDCGGGTFSSYSSTTFATPCATSSIPYSQGFNSTSIPPCWSQQFITGTSSVTFVASSSNPTTTPQEGTNYAFWNSFSITSGNETRLVSPALSTTGTSSVDVNFYWFNENNTSYSTGNYLLEGVTVQYSLDGTTWIDAGTLYPRHDASLPSGTGQWKLKAQTLPAGAGNQSTIYVGFKFHSSFGDNCSMDNVLINATPLCSSPGSPVASAITGTTATETWTTGNGATTYDWELRTTGACGSGLPLQSGSTASTSVNLTGLTASTTYTFCVRSSCGGGNFSTYSSSTFSTLYDPCATVSNISVCGTPVSVIIPAGSGAYNFSGTSPNNSCGFSTPGKEILYTFTPATSGIYEIQQTASFGFIDYLFKAASGGCTGTGWTCIKDLNGASTSSTAAFNATAGTQYYLILDPESTTGGAVSFNIVCPATCSVPTAVSNSSVTTTSANISWTCTGCTGTYNLDYGTSGHTAGTGTIITGVTSPYTLSGLTSGTTYTVYVQQSCGIIGTSAWSTGTTFTTLTPPPANDNVCSAATLSFGTSTSYSTIGATVQTGEVAPPGTGCSTNNSWCNNTLSNTIWFKFTAPSSGRVSVQSPGFDTQLALWSAASCSPFTGFTPVAANDDDLNYATHGGVQYSSYLTALCLTPGTTYYVQLDPYSSPGSSTTIVLTDLGAVNTTFSGLSPDYCVDGDLSQLIPATPGGVFSGTGVIADQGNYYFDPVTAGAGGPYTITYTLGCNSSSQTTTVHALPNVTLAPFAPVCTATPAFTLTGGSPSGGYYTVDNVIATTFNPGTASVGSHSIKYIYSDAYGCASFAQQSITVNPATTYYEDADGDGFGNPSSSISACSVPPGYVSNSTDCNDGSAAINPGATEVCDGIDNDCDGLIDSADPSFADNTPPTITCPVNVTTNTNTNQCSASGVALGTPVTADNCGVASVTNNAPASYPVGTTTVTWTVTDAHSNTATCTQSVTVTDNEIPSIACPGGISVNADPGQNYASNVNIGTPITSDNCGVASVTNNHPSTTYNLGTTTVTWTVTDVHGNTNTCTQTVTVTDGEAPSITCPATVVVSNDAGACSASNVNIGTATASDNDGIASITNDHPSSTYPVGSTTVTWTATDNQNNSATCTQTVTVTDNENPVITCPANKTVNASPGQCSKASVALGTPVTSDNCGVATTTNDAPASYPVGVTTVTWTVTDIHGNTNTCTQTVTVNDNQNPTITCPANVTESTASGQCSASSVALGTPVTADNCGVASVTNDAPASFPVGTTTVTWTVTDIHSNTATCTQSVTVTDDENPSIACPGGISVNTDAGQNYASNVNTGTPATSDNCGVASVTNDHPSTTYNLGTTTVTWTVTDVHGNTNTCTQTVTVTDGEAPVITCPATVVVSNDAGACSASNVNIGTATASDNDGIASITNDHPSSTYPVGSTTVTWTATDNQNNSSTCTQTVTVTDNENPVITCPANKNVNASPGQCSKASVALGTPVTSDNCGIASTTNDAPAGNYPVGVTTVTWTVTDVNGNTATCTQTVTVNDNQNPTITCPANVTTTAASGQCSASSVALGTPVTADNCGVASVTNDAPALYPVGTTTVTWTVTDIHSNTASCTQSVTVTDDENPSIACPGGISVNADPGQNYASNVNIGTSVTSDNCGVASVTNDHPSTTYNLGTTTVTWTVTDVHGNTNTCTQTVTVTDGEAPVITCPATVVASSDAGMCSASNVNIGTATASDNDGIASITNDHPSSTYPVGSTTVTWTATDNQNNSATCTQTVTVTDDQNPAITCPANVTASSPSGQCSSSSIVLGTPVTSDNCGVASITNDAPASYPVGTTTVTWTVTDIHSNTATCTQSVTVTDNENPTIACPGGISVNSDPGKNYATGVNTGTPVTSDNCGVASVTNDHPSTTYNLGTTTVTWTVTDVHGNTNTCTQTVTVTDGEAPAITCPATVVVSNDAGACSASNVNIGTATASDNDGIASITNDHPSSTYPVGSTTVTWTATDNQNNSSTCTQTVTVNDNENPVITCPANKTVNASPGQCSKASVALGTPVTSDNCGIASTTNDAPASYPVGVTTVTWTVTDIHGNTNTCTQTVTVNDNQNPTITCPANVTTTAASGQCSASSVALGTPVTADNCGVASVTNDAPASYPVGTTTVTWTVTDIHSNTATCTQTVTVTDNENPTIACPGGISVNADPGQNYASNVNTGTPVTSDNCGVASVTNDHPSTTYNLGTTTVTWTVTDVHGNTNTCTQTVTVTDGEAPVITCPATVVASSDAGMCSASNVNIGTATASDNDGIASITNDHPSSTYPVGSTTVTWTATDNQNNSSTCTQTVTVNDNENPVITCPPNKNVNASAGQCSKASVSLGTAVVSDNCGVASLTNDAPASYPVGVTMVTWTVTDIHGNTNTCTQTVTVNDNQNPTITCPPNVTVGADANQCSASGVVLGSPVTSDNCGVASVTNDAPASYPNGTTTVTWTVTDIHANTSTCTQTVTVTPNAEVCNGLDDDCNGMTDDGLPQFTYYADSDLDGYGNGASPFTTCQSTAPSGYTVNNTDCNDASASVNPGAIEACGNGIDDNCNGSIDEGCTVYTYYADADGDTYGDPNNSITSNSNVPPAGYVGNNTDCNDANAFIHPGATDVCNGVDDDCDGTVDENAITATITPAGTVNSCRGTPITLTANSDANLTYQWYRNGNPIAGATNSTLSTIRKGSFYVVESNGICSATSNTTSNNVQPVPAATITANGSLDICTTGSVELRANTSSTHTLTYQWKKSSVAISGATKRNYFATGTGSYTVTVTNENGCSNTSAATTVYSSCRIGEATEMVQAQLSLYPNPNSGQFIIELQLSGDVNEQADIEILNTLGQSIYLNRTAVVNGKLFEEVKLDGTVPAGNYFIRVTVGSEVYNGRIIYQK